MYKLTYLIYLSLVTFAYSQQYDTVNFNSSNGILNFDNNDQIEFGNKVLERTDGSLLITGRSGPSSNIANTPVLYCVNTDGTTCSNFGTNGSVVVSTISLSGTYDQAIQSDDKAIILGNFNGDLRLLRLSSSGTVDDTFANNGVLDIPPPNDALGTAGNGKVFTLTNNAGIIAIWNYRYANSPTRFKTVVYKINTSGSLDTDFGNQGILNLDYGNSSSFCKDFIEVSGSYYFLSSGTPSGGSGFITQLEKTDAFGAADSNFAVNGVLEIQNANLGSSMYITANKIAFCGNSSASGQASLEIGLFNLDGSIDTAFSSSGIQYFRPFNNSEDRGRDIIIQPDGKLLVLFETRIGTVGEDGAMLRLQTNGTLDPTFNDTNSASPNGVFSLQTGGGNNEKNNMILKNNGNLFITGYANYFSPTRFDITLSKLIISDAVLSIDVFIDNDVYLYPNPANNVLYIHSQNSGKSFSMINVLGKRVLTNTIINNTIPVETLSPGLYFVEIDFPSSGKRRFKFIKN